MSDRGTLTLLPGNRVIVSTAEPMDDIDFERIGRSVKEWLAEPTATVLVIGIAVDVIDLRAEPAPDRIAF